MTRTRIRPIFLMPDIQHLTPNMKKRSPIHHKLSAQGAVFAERYGADCAVSFGKPAQSEAGAARNMAVSDLSPLPRIGFKGANAVGWLESQDVAVNPLNNKSQESGTGTGAGAGQGSGIVSLRLGDAEVLLLGEEPRHVEFLDGLSAAAAAERPPYVYTVPRGESNACFLICGRDASAMLAKLCAVDFRPQHFAQGDVAQTLVASVVGIVVRADLGGLTAYRLLVGSAVAEYVWDCLQDAMAEYGGLTVGLDAVELMKSQ